MPLWILLAILLIGGITVVTTIKSNTRKAVTTAYALEAQRELAAERVKAITAVAESAIRIGTKVEPLRSRAKQFVAAALAEIATATPAPATTPNGSRPGLLTPQDRLSAQEKELEAALNRVEACDLTAKDIMELAEQEKMEVMREVVVKRAQLKVTSLDATLVRIQDTQQQAEKTHASAELLLSQMETLSNEIIETERLRRAQEERDRLEAEHKKQLAADQERAKQQHGAMMDLAATFQFEDAMKQVQSMAPLYQTDEGRQRHTLMVDQCTELVAMKKELIAMLNAAPFAWGWRQDGSPRDIDSATPEALIVGDRQIPWNNVLLPQMLSILNDYICGESVKPTIRSDHCIAMAIFLASHHRTDAARTMVDTGVSMRPAIKPKADRLTATVL